MFQSEMTRPYLLSRILASAAVPSLRIVNVLKSELPQQIADDPDHRIVIVNNKNRHRQVDGHSPLPVTHAPDGGDSAAGVMVERSESSAPRPGIPLPNTRGNLTKRG